MRENFDPQLIEDLVGFLEQYHLSDIEDVLRAEDTQGNYAINMACVVVVHHRTYTDYGNSLIKVASFSPAFVHLLLEDPDEFFDASREAICEVCSAGNCIADYR